MPASNAQRVHDELVIALERLRNAERSAVTLFARVLQERLFGELGYATIELYGTEGLGLTAGKTQQFLRLARALEDLPAIRKALDRGELPWTKARTLASVITPRTESRWLAEASRLNSRELEERVKSARVRGRRERARLRSSRGQSVLPLSAPRREEPAEVPVRVGLVMTPVEHARFEGLLETLRNGGDRRTRSELIVDGLALLAEAGNPRGISSTPYKVVAYTCESCNKTSVHGRDVDPAAAEAIRCDALHLSSNPDVPNRHTIPPSVRRAVLARDGHRCTTEACGAVHHLEVHHIVPRSRGGAHALGNLITLCSACHRHHHQRTSTCPGPESSPRVPCPT